MKSSSINNETLELARQLRQLTQKEVAEMVNLTQGQLSKAEHGIQELDNPTLERLASCYDVPLDFFYQELDPTPVSHYYYRKRVTSNKVLDGFIALVQIFKMFIEDLLSPIELPDFDIPTMSTSKNLSPTEIANRTRYSLGLYRGPVPNLTTLLENHGVIIVKIDFGTNKLDGLSTYDNKGRRIIFLNSQMPNDRQRFSLAHELGHTIMHSEKLPTPDRDVEAEANEFASQFLMPFEEIGSMLNNVSLYDLSLLKKKWKVSIKALLYRAKSLCAISDREYRNLQILYSKKGFNYREPCPLANETPILLYETINLYRNELGYTDDDLMKLMHIGKREFFTFFHKPQLCIFNPIYKR